MEDIFALGKGETSTEIEGAEGCRTT